MFTLMELAPNYATNNKGSTATDLNKEHRFL